MQIKLKKRPSSPASPREERHVRPNKRKGKGRRIRFPSSSGSRQPISASASASAPIPIVKATKPGPRWAVATESAISGLSGPVDVPADVSADAEAVAAPLNYDSSLTVFDDIMPLPMSDIDMLVSEPEMADDPLALTEVADPISEAEEAVEDVRAAVADVDIDSRSSGSFVTANEEVSSLSREVPTFQGLSSITGGKSALEYLRARRAQRLASQAASTRASNPPSIEIETKEESPEEDQMSVTEWRQVVEQYGDSDFEGVLDSDTDTLPSSLPSALDYSLCRVNPADQPPPERRGKALRDFDCAMVDEWNRLAPTMTRNPDLHRAIFEAYIAQSELESGEIKVFNDVDAEGAPPDFEFECSNDMLYHPQVPDPELGLGCGCQGPCDPRSAMCSCLKRQKLYFYNLEHDGFAYDEWVNGRSPFGRR